MSELFVATYRGSIVLQPGWSMSRDFIELEFDPKQPFDVTYRADGKGNEEFKISQGSIYKHYVLDGNLGLSIGYSSLGTSRSISDESEQYVTSSSGFLLPSRLWLKSENKGPSKTSQEVPCGSIQNCKDVWLQMSPTNWERWRLRGDLRRPDSLDFVAGGEFAYKQWLFRWGKQGSKVPQEIKMLEKKDPTSFKAEATFILKSESLEEGEIGIPRTLKEGDQVTVYRGNSGIGIFYDPKAPLFVQADKQIAANEKVQSYVKAEQKRAETQSSPSLVLVLTIGLVIAVLAFTLIKKQFRK